MIYGELGTTVRITTPYQTSAVQESLSKIIEKTYSGYYYNQKKEKKQTMKATYNGFTGELEKLERTHYGDCRYSLSIYDDDNKVTHSFTMVKLEDVKFLGGAVSFGG